MIFNVVHIDGLAFRIGFVFSRAGADADTAAGAVFRRHLPNELFAGKFLAFISGRFETFRRVFQFFFRSDFHTDNAVRADQRAFAALDAGFRIPNRDFGSDAAFFVLSGSGRPGSVNDFAESRYRQFVTTVGNDFTGQLFNEFRRIGRNRQRAVES